MRGHGSLNAEPLVSAYNGQGLKVFLESNEGDRLLNVPGQGDATQRDDLVDVIVHVQERETAQFVVFEAPDEDLQ